MNRQTALLGALLLGLPSVAIADPDPAPAPLTLQPSRAQEPVGLDVPRDVMDAARLAFHAQSLTPRISQPGEGALEGRTIALSPGHGIVYDEGWGFQRGITEGIREDLSNAQWMNDYLIEMVERAGGTVVNLRERSYGEQAVVVDNDASGPDYAEVGAWQPGASDGFGGTYRAIATSAAGDATATWHFEVPESGDYPIYVTFLSGENRSDAAHYLVTHAYGDEEVVVAQNTLRVENADYAGYPNNPPASDAVRAPSQIWQYLGTFPFEASAPYAVTLSNVGTDPERYVIADAIHVGGGMGTVLGGGEVSGRPRWEESASTFLSWSGSPSWMQVGDVSERPLYAIYRGVDAYVAIHTNCCESSGTSTYTWYPEMWVRESAWPAGFAENELPPGTHEMATAMHDEVIRHVRAYWQDDWPDQGRLGANFGELRALRNGWYEDVHTYGIADPMTIPSMLIEVGYHDTAHDAALIRETRFRRDVARGMLVGLIRFFADDDNAEVPPLAPEKLWTHLTDDGLEVYWEPQIDIVTGMGTPTRYHVYTSTDGVLFDTTPLETTDTHLTLPLDGCAPLYVRVSAVNDAGASLDSPVVGGQRARAGGALVRVIDGVEREVKLVTDPNNQRSYARIWGPAIAAALPGAGFTIATDEAPRDVSGDAWVWILGETSTRFGTLDTTAQDDIAAALDAGIPVIVSGAELGWDLVERGDADDTRFFEDVLGVTYTADDAEQTQVDASAVALGTLDFGTCDADTVCVEYPDVLTAGAGDTALMAYAGGAGDAVVLSETGAIVAGFPLEAIAEGQRNAALAALLARVLDPALASDGACDPIVEEDTGTEDVGEQDTGVADTGTADDTGTTDDTGAPDTGSEDDTGSESDADGDTGVSTDTAVADSGTPSQSAQSSTGCGCAATPSSAPPAWIALFGALLVWRRRARSARA